MIYGVVLAFGIMGLIISRIVYVVSGRLISDAESHANMVVIFAIILDTASIYLIQWAIISYYHI